MVTTFLILRGSEPCFRAILWGDEWSVLPFDYRISPPRGTIPVCVPLSSCMALQPHSSECPAQCFVTGHSSYDALHYCWSAPSPCLLVCSSSYALPSSTFKRSAALCFKHVFVYLQNRLPYPPHCGHAPSTPPRLSPRTPPGKNTDAIECPHRTPRCHRQGITAREEHRREEHRQGRTPTQSNAPLPPLHHHHHHHHHPPQAATPNRYYYSHTAARGSEHESEIPVTEPSSDIGASKDGGANQTEKDIAGEGQGAKDNHVVLWVVLEGPGTLGDVVCGAFGFRV